VSTDSILIWGAREPNPKNSAVELPRNQLIVFACLTRTGQSSLTFDSVNTGGQHHYVGPAYAHQRRRWTSPKSTSSTGSLRDLLPQSHAQRSAKIRSCLRSSNPRWQ